MERRLFSRARWQRTFRDVPVDVRDPLILRDVSYGGFSVESPIAFDVGEVQSFGFDLSQNQSVIVRAVVTHCLRPDREHGEQTYIVGFAFLTSGIETLRTISAIVQCKEFPQPPEVTIS